LPSGTRGQLRHYWPSSRQQILAASWGKAAQEANRASRDDRRGLELVEEAEVGRGSRERNLGTPRWRPGGAEYRGGRSAKALAQIGGSGEEK
jgi:hypothetical protein